MPLFPTLSQNARLRYATFFYLYFMQGVPSGFAITALGNYLTAQGISSVTLGTYGTIIGIPWIIQLVWGPLIDRYRYSVVGHYKHWVVLTQVAALAASFVLLIVHRPEQQVWLLAFLFFVHSIVASVQDASVDAMAILITPPAERGRVNAFMRGGILLGGAFGAAVLSIVLHSGGYQTAVLVQSGILLFFTLLFFVTKLHRTDPLLPQFKNVKKEAVASTEEPQLRTVFRQLGTALTGQRSLRIFGVIILSYLFFSVFGSSLGFYLIRTLKWPDQELSVLTGGWGSLVTLVVIMTCGVLADKLGATRLQRMVITVLALFILLFSVALFTITAKPAITAGLLFWSIADPLYSVAALPICMVLCRRDIAGSQFTAYMALVNFAGIGGGYASGWLLTVVPGPVLGVVSGVGLMVLTFLLFRYKRQLEPVEETVQKVAFA